ncbi:MAG: PilN domain-containing protein, partial [bacterium]
MIELNLLPPKVRAAELLRKTITWALVAYALAAGWLLWQWELDHSKLVQAQHEVQRVQAQLNSPELQVAVQAVKKFADDMAAVKAKASVVNALRQQQVPLLQALDTVPDWGMGGQVWFTDLAISAGKGGGETVELGAETQTRSQFAAYYEFLSGLPGVSGLALDGEPQDTMVAGNRVVRFKVSFTLEG